MENIRILSMNLGRSFVPVKDRKRKAYITDFINEEGYDIVMLQGDSIKHNINLKQPQLNSSYNKIVYNDKVATLYKSSLPFDDEVMVNFSYDVPVTSSIFSYKDFPMAFINVNCEDPYNIDSVCDICDSFGNDRYLPTRVVAGRFPREVNINRLCQVLALDDISTLVRQEMYVKNNREMLNHFFISRNLECMNVHKLTGMTEISGIGEAYPIEVTLKKVLK